MSFCLQASTFRALHPYIKAWPLPSSPPLSFSSLSGLCLPRASYFPLLILLLSETVHPYTRPGLPSVLLSCCPFSSLQQPSPLLLSVPRCDRKQWTACEKKKVERERKWWRGRWKKRVLTGKNAQWGSGPCIPTNKQSDVGKTERRVKEGSRKSRDLKGANGGRWLVVLSHRSLRSRLKGCKTR